MSYKTEFQSNNTDLQAILDKVNALPEAGDGGAVIETCTVSFAPGPDEVVVCYNALVDGGIVAKTQTFISGQTDNSFTDIVKGTTLSVWSTDDGWYDPFVTGEAEELYTNGDYTEFCYAINGDCQLSFAPGIS